MSRRLSSLGYTLGKRLHTYTTLAGRRPGPFWEGILPLNERRGLIGTMAGCVGEHFVLLGKIDQLLAEAH